MSDERELPELVKRHKKRQEEEGRPVDLVLDVTEEDAEWLRRGREERRREE